ncbi:ammonium transporter [Propionicicella superfundia]|uniref:ammonium transporter n=1 Tax=Propionicicella superfundia TaxID=348582 RepID=UPI0004220D46|nr:ammonium transporter [Propionicicella superfundia]
MIAFEIDSGDTAWVLASAALVLLMTPGLALFYGGMVRAKGVLNTMMMSFISMGTIGVIWVLYGYSLAFGNSVGGLGIIGNPLEFLGLKGLMAEDAVAGTVPALAFVAFQSAFAIITVALVSGAIADRAKFTAWTVFTIVWGTLVYFPAAHWVFAFSSEDGSVVGGWIANQIQALDFAGGTAIHINAGAAALALALVLGPRIGFGAKPMRPHNLTLVMLGAALLWFGWFGFNAGSAVAANASAALAWVNTLVATSAAMLSWLVVEKVRDGHPTSLGAASGIVAGLVGITPAAGSVGPLGAILIGILAGVACAYAVGLKYKLGYDDSLDVVGVHLVGGLVGTLMIGFVADPASSAGVAGLFYGGGLDQLWRQAVGAFAVLIYSFCVTWVIGKVIDMTIGFRVTPAEESSGIDLAEHAENGYILSSVGYGTYRGVQHTTVLEAGDLPPSASKADEKSNA